MYSALHNCVANSERMLSDTCKDRRVTSANINQVFKIKSPKITRNISKNLMGNSLQK